MGINTCIVQVGSKIGNIEGQVEYAREEHQLNLIMAGGKGKSRHTIILFVPHV